MERLMTQSCPYVGLTPYTEEQAAYFFGREREIRLIASKLYAARLTLLYGASGVGKSSVLRAGVAHSLRQEDGVAAVVFSTWQSDPLAGLRTAVSDEVRRVIAARGETTELSFTGAESLGDILRAGAEQVGPVMLILDQFEEYFLYHLHDDSPESFVVEFAKAVNRDDVPASFLVAIREDAYTKLDRFKGRIPNLFANYVHLEHLNATDARAAIRKPIDRYNEDFKPQPEFEVEVELVEAVVEQVGVGKVTVGGGEAEEVSRLVEHFDTRREAPDQAQVEAPYLQLVLTRLWDEETHDGSHKLRLATLNRLGGAERIVRTHLDDTMRTLSPNEQEDAAQILQYLVTPSCRKIAYTLNELAQLAHVSEDELLSLLQKLSTPDRRIVRPVAPPPDQPQETSYEIFHDVLAPALRDWRARYVSVRERDEAAQQAAVEAAEREREAARRRWVIWLSLISILAVVLAIIALVLWVKASQNATEASHSAVVARAERGTAQADRDVAATARANADQQKAIAEDERGTAQIERDIAATARANADQQKAIAEDERGTAQIERDVAATARAYANQQKATAEAERGTAQAERDMARTAAAERDEAVASLESSLQTAAARTDLSEAERAQAMEELQDVRGTQTAVARTAVARQLILEATQTAVMQQTSTATSQGQHAVHPSFNAMWQELGGGSGLLGNATGPAITDRNYARQHFEKGLMFWWDSPTPPQFIWVVAVSDPDAIQGTTWSLYYDGWDSSKATFPPRCPEAREPLGPRRGFGIIWCDQPGVRDLLGAPVEEEFGSGDVFDQGAVQFFEHGVMFENPADQEIWALIGGAGWRRVRY